MKKFLLYYFKNSFVTSKDFWIMTIILCLAIAYAIVTALIVNYNPWFLIVVIPIPLIVSDIAVKYKKFKNEK